MKRILLFLLPFIAIYVVGCGPKATNPTPVSPEGAFTGTFVRLHLHQKTGVIDTLKINNITVKMESSTGFSVSGDTTQHAASHGSYTVYNANDNILFNDVTYPTDGSTPAKVHLSGLYLYQYDGTALSLLAYSALDTIAYSYTLTRSGN